MTIETLSDSFTYVQMNFWWGRLFYPIDVFLKREQPDIFVTQEMLSGEGYITPSFWTAEALIDKEHFDNFNLGLFEPAMNTHKGDFTAHCATFTKKPVICEFEKRIKLYENPDATPREKHHENYYSLLHTQLRLQDGSLVHVLNHHGYIIRSEEARFHHPIADYNFKKIAGYIATLTGPVILSGDFNLVKEASSLQPLKDMGMTNLNDIHNISVGRNEFSWRANEMVSHVFINDLVVVDEYRIATDNVSDHLPIVMKCRVKAS